MNSVQLGRSELHVTPICLGTMTFGEQVDEATAHRILDRAVERGVTFIDTAEMYPVPQRSQTFTHTERFIGNWLVARPALRQKLVLATKVAGPARGMNWIRGGKADLDAADIIAACDDSLRRLRTDVIDLYQIHWPSRAVPMFGNMHYRPETEQPVTSIHEQLRALGDLVQAGKVRAIGLSNETPYGVHEFVHLAEQHGLPRVASVQNVYSLVSRGVENALDETLHRLGVSLLAYSPLAFGLLTGKYDHSGICGPDAPVGARIATFESVRKQRWGRPQTVAASLRYNALARETGLTPTQMALAFCYTQWQVTSTILGATTVAQLDENIDAYGTVLSTETRDAIDAIRLEVRDPAC